MKDPGARALFHPRSIAIIGASSDARRIGGRPVDYTRRNFRGTLYPVNPNQSEIQGIKAYPSISAIPGEVDLALIALPAAAAPGALDECIAKGVKAVAMFSSGFGEVSPEGRAVQEAMHRRCAAAGVRLLGPNCLGVLSLREGVMLTFSTVLEMAWPKVGSTSLVSLSGAVGIYTMSLMMDRGIGMSRWIATGNEADVDVAQCLEWMAEDDETRCVAVYFEGCRDLPRLQAAIARCTSRGKAVVVLKSGVTAPGQVCVKVHTGADPGSDEAYEALLREAGAYRAQSVEELVDIVYACSKGAIPAGPRLGVVSISGGINVLAADAAVRVGLELPEMPAAAQEQIRALIPFGCPLNPIDTTAQFINDPSLVRKLLDILLEQGGVDSVIIYLQTLGRLPSTFAPFGAAIESACERHPGKLFVLCGACEPTIQSELEAKGFLVFEDPWRCTRAVAGLWHFGRRFGPRPAGA